MIKAPFLELSYLPALSARVDPKAGGPPDLEKFWIGHREEEVGDPYLELKDDVEFRKEVTERIGLEISNGRQVVGIAWDVRLEAYFPVKLHLTDSHFARFRTYL